MVAALIGSINKQKLKELLCLFLESYPEITLVQPTGTATTLDDFSVQCGTGKRLVSLQSVDHAFWLRDQIVAQGYGAALTSAGGIPLAADMALLNV